jgi:hypothetical protein
LTREALQNVSVGRATCTSKTPKTYPTAQAQAAAWCWQPLFSADSEPIANCRWQRLGLLAISDAQRLQRQRREVSGLQLTRKGSG